VLVFDQFEELFTLGRSGEPARHRGALLLQDLSGLVENRPPAALKRLGDSGDADPSLFDFGPSACKALLSLREDFLADLHKLKPLFPRSFRTNGPGADDRGSRRRVIEEPGGIWSRRACRGGSLFLSPPPPLPPLASNTKATTAISQPSKSSPRCSAWSAAN